MKKLTSACLLSSAFMASFVQADTLLGLYVGVQGWRMDTEGGFANESSLTRFDFEDETKSSFYVALEHPIPFLPNVKIRRTEMDALGNVTLTSNFTFAGTSFSSQTDVTTDADLSNTDFILYYELFDNDLISFDFGVNGKYVDGSLLVRADREINMSAEESFSAIVPMLYSRFEVGVPATGLGAFLEASYLAIDGHSLTDYQAALTYTFVDNLAIDVSVQLGYRAVVLELEDLDDVYTDLDFNGAFAGIQAHF